MADHPTLKLYPRDILLSPVARCLHVIVNFKPGLRGCASRKLSASAVLMSSGTQSQ